MPAFASYVCARGPRERGGARTGGRGAHEQGQGLKLGPSIADSAHALFAQPYVAAVLGAALGAAMLLATRHGVRFMTPEAPELGVARAVAFSTLGMIAAFVALLLYYLFVRTALVPFGLGLVVGFLVPAFIALFSASGLVRPATPRR